MTSASPPLTSRILNATVIVTALGYFVDFYDLLLFSITRTPSLTDLHLAGDALTSAGLFISNCQFIGLIVGSYLCGVLGDKLGRRSVLLASILIYSLANLYCGFVQTVDHYALGRFFTGVGVAAELGVGLTLIAERLLPDRRGYGIAFFIILGFFGLFSAVLVADNLSWRQAYLVGGAAGLVLLFLRTLVFESTIYQNMAARTTRRGGLGIIIRNPRLLRRYIACILLMTPTTFIPQIVWTLSPELAKAQGVSETVQASTVLLAGYVCVVFGDLLACLLCEKLGSRKKAILFSYLLGIVFFLKYLFMPSANAVEFYVANALLGFAFGIWVVGNALIVEQVGTNIRCTVATTANNFARGLVVLMNILFASLKPMTGSLTAVGIIGCIIFAASLWGWWHVEETYGKNLNYEEA